MRAYCAVTGIDAELSGLAPYFTGRKTMNFDEFTGEVQHRLELPGAGEAVRPIRATLMTLGQRIPR
nr:DUF2267 domain-containing protein [Haloarcula sp. 1CSR25-25]